MRRKHEKRSLFSSYVAFSGVVKIFFRGRVIPLSGWLDKPLECGCRRYGVRRGRVMGCQNTPQQQGTRRHPLNGDRPI